MINLEIKYINILKETISKYLLDYKLFLYGSRVKGNARPYSDVDIAIASDELNDVLLNKIKFAIENTVIPYNVDVININNISIDFRKLIQDTLTEI